MGSHSWPMLQRLTRAPSWLPLTAIVAVAFGVTAIWVRSIHQFGVMPDEIGYVKQALQIARTGMLVAPHDYWFGSWNQLLPLISAPVFGAMNMVDAFYAVHTLYALVLASTAVPTYLIARSLGLGRLAANLAGALSVAVPWMLLAGVIMTEDVAYPAFAWAILAFLRAMQQPSVRRDLVALAGLALVCFARTQFVFLGPVLVASVLIHDLRMAVDDPAQTSRRGALVVGLRRTLAGHRVLWAFSAVVVAAVVIVKLTGSGAFVLGSYVSTTNGSLVPPGTIAAGLVQLDSTMIAIGVVPLMLTGVWTVATLVRPQEPRRHAFAVLAPLTIVGCALVGGSFAQRYLSGGTSDFYTFELVPLLCVGTVAWVVDKRGSALGLALAGVATLWLLLADGLHDNTGSIINPSFNFQHALVHTSAVVGNRLGIGAIDARVTLTVFAVALGAGAATVRRWAPTWAALLAVTLPLLGYGVLSTGYAMHKVSAVAAGVPASYPQELNGLDRLLGPDADVGLMLATNGSTVDTWYTWWQPYFWDKSVQRAFVLPGGDDFSQGFVGTVTPDLATGHLLGLDGVRYLLRLSADTRFGLPARPLNPGSTQPIVPTPTDRLLYGTRGVRDTGALVWASHPLVRMFDPASARVTEQATLVIGLTGPVTGCPCRLSAGPGRPVIRVANLAGGATQTVRLRSRVTISRGGHVDLPLSLQGPGSGPVSARARLLSVTVGQG